MARRNTKSVTLLRLTDAVANPVRDKRCTYGLRGIDQWPAGTPIVRTEWDDGQVRVAINGSSIWDEDVCEALLNNAELSSPKTALEAMDLALVDRHHADSLLDFMVANNTLSTDAVTSACAGLLHKWYGEDDA